MAAKPIFDDALLDELGRIYMDLAMERLIEEAETQAEIKSDEPPTMEKANGHE